MRVSKCQVVVDMEVKLHSFQILTGMMKSQLYIHAVSPQRQMECISWVGRWLDLGFGLGSVPEEQAASYPSRHPWPPAPIVCIANSNMKTRDNTRHASVSCRIMLSRTRAGYLNCYGVDSDWYRIYSLLDYNHMGAP
jgi:hypothetical protein